MDHLTCNLACTVLLSELDADLLLVLSGGIWWDLRSDVNKFVNGSFYRRISPTSFYALQTSAPNNTQATAMMEQWLFNKDGFCVAEQGDFSGLDDTCYWGLPSIQASDPAYPPLGYVGSLVYDVSICVCLQLISLCMDWCLASHRSLVAWLRMGSNGPTHPLVVAELRPCPGRSQRAKGSRQTDGCADDVSMGE